MKEGESEISNKGESQRVRQTSGEKQDLREMRKAASGRALSRNVGPKSRFCIGIFAKPSINEMFSWN